MRSGDEATEITMTVATATGGTTIAGATLGAGFLESGEITSASQGLVSASQGASEVLRTLPFTGANHLVLLTALGLLVLLAGALMTGLARRHGDAAASPPAA